MDALREYLNNLFLGLPETPEVLRAKAELLENMEDKYEELIREGKTEKEAIGIVISEFGDLQELAGELGIEEYMNNIRSNADGKFAECGAQGMNGSKQSAGRNGKDVEKVFRWGFDETKKYISYAWTHALLIAAAVFLCIFAPFIVTIFEACGASGYVTYMIAEVVGVSLFFLLVAVAVVLFLSAYEMKKRYGNISHYGIMLDTKAGEYAAQKYQKETHLRLIMRFCGIFLCIVSVVPSSVNYFSDPFVSEIIDSSVLFIAGLGVFLIVMSASAGNRYDELQKAVKNAAGLGKTENREGSGMIWNTPEGDGAYAGWEQTGKKKMSS
ncbi:MAG: hypothetical protein HFH14_02435, partial [Lachnospiraceae bacterium]|nr:hypothetical protein [Lachnospiraceae bacterium]